jgi:hypothetical protein
MRHLPKFISVDGVHTIGTRCVMIGPYSPRQASRTSILFIAPR